jgi:hypothetical protein
MIIKKKLIVDEDCVKIEIVFDFGCSFLKMTNIKQNYWKKFITEKDYTLDSRTIYKNANIYFLLIKKNDLLRVEIGEEIFEMDFKDVEDKFLELNLWYQKYIRF